MRDFEGHNKLRSGQILGQALPLLQLRAVAAHDLALRNWLQGLWGRADLIVGYLYMYVCTSVGMCLSYKVRRV